MVGFIATNAHFQTAALLGIKLAKEDAEANNSGDYMWDSELDHNEQDILFLITNDKIDPDQDDAQSLLECVEDNYYKFFDDREDDVFDTGDYEDELEDSDHH